MLLEQRVDRALGIDQVYEGSVERLEEGLRLTRLSRERLKMRGQVAKRRSPQGGVVVEVGVFQPLTPQRRQIARRESGRVEDLLCRLALIVVRRDAMPPAPTRRYQGPRTARALRTAVAKKGQATSSIGSPTSPAIHRSLPSWVTMPFARSKPIVINTQSAVRPGPAAIST